jgi:hypothetical protein
MKRRNSNGYLFWLLVALGALVLNAESLGQGIDAKAIFDSCADAVVYIQTPNAFGTGFFINREYVITNCHVLLRATSPTEQDQNAFAIDQIGVFLRSGEELQVQDVDLFIDHPRIDLAALRTFPATHTWLPLSPTIPSVGEEVAAIGHPIGSKWSIETGNVSNIRSTTHLQLTVGSQRGYSGSPAINKSGQVVGICSKGLVQIPTIVYFIRSDVLIELLDYYDIAYTTEERIQTATERIEQELEERIQIVTEKIERFEEATRENIRALEQRERDLKTWEQRLTQQQIDLEHKWAEFNAERSKASAFLAKYRQRKQELDNMRTELDDRARKLSQWEVQLNQRELRIAQKERTIWEKLPDHFSIDLIAHPVVEVLSGRFVPLRMMGGLYYRFRFVRNSDQEVIRADKFGIVATRQLSPLGWAYDELGVALEFGSMVRVMVGTILQQPDRALGRVVTPGQRRYTTSLLVDFSTSSPVIVGLAASAQTDERFREPSVMAGVIFGYDLTFFRW